MPVPQSWFDRYEGAEWRTHPFNRLAWFLNDEEENIDEDTFDRLIKHLEYIYDKEFLDLHQVDVTTKEEQALMKQANDNVYKKLVKEYEKKRNEDPDVLPILAQSEEGAKPPSFYDLGYNAHAVSIMITNEYKRLQKKAEAKKEEPVKEEPSVKPKRKVSTSKTKKESTSTTVKKKTSSATTKKSTSTKPKATKTRAKVAK